MRNAGRAGAVGLDREAVPRDSWFHAFATYDGSGKAAGVKLYVNGQLRASQPWTGIPGPTTTAQEMRDPFCTRWVLDTFRNAGIRGRSFDELNDDRGGIAGSVPERQTGADNKQAQGFVHLTKDGHVSEGSAENIFVVRNGSVVTPPVKDNILEGITRATLMHHAGVVLDWVLKGRLQVRIDRTYPLEQAAEAHKALASRQTSGKVLLIPPFWL